MITSHSTSPAPTRTNPDTHDASSWNSPSPCHKTQPGHVRRTTRTPVRFLLSRASLKGPRETGRTFSSYRMSGCPPSSGDTLIRLAPSFIRESRDRPSGERVVALLLPFAADEVGLEAGLRPLRDPRARRSWEARAGELDHQHDQQHPSPTGEPTQRAMTESVISRTYETLSVNSPEALELWGRGRATAGTATAAVSVRAGVLTRPRRSSGVQPGDPRPSWQTPPRVITGEGGPIASRKCIGLALSPATKNQVGRSGGLRCAA